MCRYGEHVYKPHFACFDCRKVFKKAPVEDFLKQRNMLHVYQRLWSVHFREKLRTEVEKEVGTTFEALQEMYQEQIATCPQCGGQMANMGRDFKAPKQTNVKAWKIIKGMYTTGYSFHTCGCSGPGYVPESPADYRAYLDARLLEYQESLNKARENADLSEDEKRDAVAYWGERIDRVNEALKRGP